MKWLLVVVSLLLPVVAQAETIHLTLQQAVEVLDALGQLSAGTQKVVKQGAQETTITEHYKGWSLSLILAQAKDINALKPPIQMYEQARTDRQRDVSDAKGI